MAKKKNELHPFDFSQIGKKYGEFTFLGRIALDSKRPDSNWKEPTQALSLFKKWVKANLDWTPDYLEKWKFVDAHQSETWGSLSIYFYNPGEQTLIRLSDHWSQTNVINEVKTILCWKVRFGFWNLVVENPQDALQLQNGNINDLNVGLIKIKDFKSDKLKDLQDRFVAIKNVSALVWRHVDFSQNPLIISDSNDKVRRLVQWIHDFKIKWLGTNVILPWGLWADVVCQSYWSNLTDFNKFTKMVLEDPVIYELVVLGPNAKDIPKKIIKFHIQNATT